jgi:hypothetical protein
MGTDPVMLYGDEVTPAKRRKGAAMLRKYMRKYRCDPQQAYPLVAVDNPVIGPFLGVKDVCSGKPGEALDAARGIAIGTIRMGYGHYRIAMSVASTAHSMGYIPYWFDLLGFDSSGARMIRDLDYWYSLASRISQKSKLFNRFVWDPLLGKAYKRVEKNYPIMEVCRMLTNVYADLPAEIPFLGTHPWPALAAMHASRKNVINMIPDNCPLGFHLAPGVMHTVQGPSMYMGFRMLKDMGKKSGSSSGVPPSEIKLVGHYVDHELVANIETDCGRRIDRMRRKQPRRLLISIGGAGAQQQLLLNLVRRLLPMVRDGRVTLFINFGDHKNVWELFKRSIPGFENDLTRHSEWGETCRYIAGAVDGAAEGLHAFLHEDTFAAVYATNLLMRASDILLTKPSELAYYPIPKLMLQRVGGHEAWGAIRAGELGDGTIECDSEPLAVQMLDAMLNHDDLLEIFCDNIVKLNRIGVYNGAYKVIEMALEGKG